MLFVVPWDATDLSLQENIMVNSKNENNKINPVISFYFNTYSLILIYGCFIAVK